ncbi:hypothetical protein CW740_06685 [Kangiella profundi]|uniref:Uncharacterized protein n=1 Tax=Kangiella profundi TaxID=1561924 RepID=A0A2K9AUX6_9GAMM|nr:hypothetical protein [Kangiella profundi]AUD78951.1 hypothetical protein CW740_06685 [Kangiella profundi]GGF02743.1 hypothetical protein GCM10011356_15550 [Kangiella profundi]
MITEASAFATIIGLLSAFSSGRESKSIAELSEFIAWLIDHKHEELANTIEQNTDITVSIKALLNHHNDELHRKLDGLGHTMALIASRVPDLTELAVSIVPNVELSEQAHSIIAQMYKNKTEFFLVSKSMNRAPILIPSNGELITYEDEQFLHDDLNTLVEHRLLRLDYNSKGSEMYYFTRTAVKLVTIST